MRLLCGLQLRDEVMYKGERYIIIATNPDKRCCTLERYSDSKRVEDIPAKDLEKCQDNTL